MYAYACVESWEKKGLMTGCDCGTGRQGFVTDEDLIAALVALQEDSWENRIAFTFELLDVDQCGALSRTALTSLLKASTPPPSLVEGGNCQMARKHVGAPPPPPTTPPLTSPSFQPPAWLPAHSIDVPGNPKAGLRLDMLSMSQRWLALAIWVADHKAG